MATYKTHFSVSIGSTYRIDSWPPSQLTGLWPLLVCNALACLKCTQPATTFIPVSSQLDFCLLLTGPLVNQMTDLLSVGLDWLDSLNQYWAGHPFLSGRRRQCDTLTTFLVDRPVLTAGFLLRWATSVSNNTLTQGKTTYPTFLLDTCFNQICVIPFCLLQLGQQNRTLNSCDRNHKGIVSNDYGKYFFLVTSMFEMIGGENESLQWDSSPAEWTITTAVHWSNTAVYHWQNKWWS